jgi:hypothetical protein
MVSKMDFMILSIAKIIFRGKYSTSFGRAAATFSKRSIYCFKIICLEKGFVRGAAPLYVGVPFGAPLRILNVYLLFPILDDKKVMLSSFPRRRLSVDRRIQHRE